MTGEDAGENLVDHHDRSVEQRDQTDVADKVARFVADEVHRLVDDGADALGGFRRGGDDGFKPPGFWRTLWSFRGNRGVNNGDDRLLGDRRDRLRRLGRRRLLLRNLLGRRLLSQNLFRRCEITFNLERFVIVRVGIAVIAIAFGDIMRSGCGLHRCRRVVGFAQDLLHGFKVAGNGVVSAFREQTVQLVDQFVFVLRAEVRERIGSLRRRRWFGRLCRRWFSDVRRRRRLTVTGRGLGLVQHLLDLICQRIVARRSFVRGRYLGRLLEQLIELLLDVRRVIRCGLWLLFSQRLRPVWIERSDYDIMSVILSSQSKPHSTTMHRFYCPDLTADDDLSVVRIDPDQARHARTVLRLSAGDTVELFNGSGLTATASIQNDDLKLLQRRQEPRLRPVLDMAVCLPKGPRADDMVNQLSQLGVDRLIPLRSARSVVDPRPRKLERFRKAAIESAKQCDRAYLMAIDPTADFSEVIGRDADVKLIADPDGEQVATLNAKHVLIVIGPEGGWTDEEHQQAQAAGFLAWSFAPHTLRIETAAVAAAAIVRSASV